MFNSLDSAIIGGLLVFSLSWPLGAAPGTTVIPNSSLISSTSLYTSNYGNTVVMTDGGNAPGIGDPSGRNDDGFSGPINLGFSLGFFGTSYTQFWVNNNGNISFNGGISDYVPSGPTGALQPVISPYFGDVDTRATMSGVVHLQQLGNEDIVTWDHVGYYDSHDDLLNTFQLVLRGSSYHVPVGEGQIGFFYTTMQWEATDTSQTSAVGFGDGSGNGEVLEGSLQNGLPSILNDKHIWFDISGNGVPTPVPNPTPMPEPASVSMIIGGIGMLLILSSRLRKGSQLSGKS